MGSRSSPRDFLPVHALDFRILMALLDGPTYGTRVVEEIEVRDTGRAKLYPANLYRRIRDLLDLGLVEEAPSPPDADRRRTYLRLTRLGRGVARAEAERLEDLVREAAGRNLLGRA